MGNLHVILAESDQLPKGAQFGVGKTLGTRFNDAMSASASIAILHRTLMVFVLLAVTLLSMGHRHSVTVEPLDPSTAAYLSAGGQLSDICAIDGGRQGEFGAHCPVCLLSPDFDLPRAVSQLRASPGQAIENSFAGVDCVKAIHAFDFSRSSRAPPRA